MINVVKNRPCLVDGCTSATYGKKYCHHHSKLKDVSLTITTDQRSKMISDCCNAKCVDGERHEYGRQYCKKCEKACCWHT